MSELKNEELFKNYSKNKGSLYNPSLIDFTKEPMFLGNGRNTQRFDNPRIPFFDKSNDKQQGDDWKHNEVPLISDKTEFRTLINQTETFIITVQVQKLIFLDSLQGRGPSTIFGQITTLPELENVLLTWTYFEGCLVPETEVCTSNGWKRIDEITTNDKVLCSDINGNGKFANPSEIHKYKSNGYITKFEGKNISQFVSDQHRMLLVDEKGKREVIRAEDMKIHKDNKISYGMVNALTSTSDSTLNQHLTDIERFLIVLQSKGIVHDSTQLTFDLKKKRTQVKFRKLLNDLDFQYQEVSYIDELVIEFEVQIPKDLNITKSFNDWINLENVSSSWGKEFVNELTDWNSCWNTTNIDNADIVEIIGSIAGYKTSRHIQENKGDKTYSLTFDTKRNFSSKKEILATKEEYTGNVHCLTVPGDFFMIRHNDKISLTGNCKHSRTYTEILRAFYDNPDKIFDDSFKIPELMKIAKKIRAVYDTAYFCVIDYVYKIQRGVSISDEEIATLKKSIIMLWVEINLLEGLRFYPGFLSMWGFKEARDILSGLAENLQLICRDENSHLSLTQFVLNLLKKDPFENFQKEYNELTSEVEDRFYEVYFEEVDWAKFSFSKGGYLGMNENITIDYLNYLFIRRAKAIGIKPNKERLNGKYITKNPVPWVNNYINMDKNEKLPQEEQVVNYISGGVEQDFDGVLTDDLIELIR